MRIYSPYDNGGGNWYKGNVHCHSTGSDGEMTPAEIAEYYRAAGYDFLAVTDHGVQTETSHLSTADFVCIPGQELSRPHMVGLGTMATIPDRLDFAGQIVAINEAGGLPFLAHPTWSGLRVEDVFAQEGMCGMEVYNYICQRLNGKGYAVGMWDELLARDKRLWATATDDSHFKPPHTGGARGWVCVKAPELGEAHILRALREGNFYSSEGPEIHSITVADNSVRVECSPVQDVFFIGVAHHGGAVHADAPEEALTEATFRPTPFMKYCRIELVDERRRRAWSNPISVEFE